MLRHVGERISIWEYVDPGGVDSEGGPFWWSCRSDSFESIAVPQFVFLFEPCGACLLCKQDVVRCVSKTYLWSGQFLAMCGPPFCRGGRGTPWTRLYPQFWAVMGFCHSSLWCGGIEKREQACSICARWPWWWSWRDGTKEWALTELMPTLRMLLEGSCAWHVVERRIWRVGEGSLWIESRFTTTNNSAHQNPKLWHLGENPLLRWKKVAVVCEFWWIIIPLITRKVK